MAVAELVLPTAYEPNPKLVLDRATIGLEDTPVPDMATVCGLPAALSVNTRFVLCNPADVGVKITFT